MSDKQVHQDILDELDFEPRINAAHIGVAVADGVVTLTGHVKTYAEKLAAEKAVKRVKGVRAVAQDIEVRHPGDKKTADDEIAKRALDVLRWCAVVPPNSIRIAVDKGWVTLTGNVDWQYQKIAAGDELRELSGITGIDNRIEVRPSVQPANIKRKIEAAFHRDARLDAQGIRVSIDGNRIILDGSVQSWHEREAAERAAWAVQGVISVENKLTIGERCSRFL